MEQQELQTPVAVAVVDAVTLLQAQAVMVVQGLLFFATPAQFNISLAVQ